MKKMFIYLTILLSFTSIYSQDCTVSNQFSGIGSGTESDPYQITNVCQLQEIKYELDAYYILINDIDASETESWNTGLGFEPIGTFNENEPKDAFTGNLNGNGYSVSNLNINRINEDDTGLFGCISDGGSIINLSLEDASVIGKNSTGILVGVTYASIMESSISIELSSTSGTIGGDGGSVGGFCGRNSAINGTTIITNCSSSAEVFGNELTGGFCGVNVAIEKSAKAEISDCNSSGNVTIINDDRAGGFCGANSSNEGEAIIIDSYSTGSTIVADEIAGGFCATNQSNNGTSIIMNCFSTGEVSGNQNGSRYLGGFCGENIASEVNARAIIDNSYSTGNVVGISNYNGGFCSLNYAVRGSVIISDSYSTGTTRGNRFIGGFCGLNRSDQQTAEATIIRSYAIGDTEGVVGVGGFCGATSTGFGLARIADCYSKGNVNAAQEFGLLALGGFVGENGAETGTSSIVRCYSIGNPDETTLSGGFCARNLSEIGLCYWDLETSAFNESDGGIGKTTNQMKTESTFITWDFNEVWAIDSDINDGYPHLRNSGIVTSVENNFFNLNTTFIPIYPNPVKDIISIELPIDINNSSIEIRDVNGEVVLESNYNKFNGVINISDLAPGTYFITAKTNSDLYHSKFVKN